MSNSDTGSHDLTVLDWIGVAIAALAAAALASFPVTIAPTFRGMFHDFSTALPGVTSLVLTSWWAPTIALVAGGCVATAIGLHYQLTLGRRRLLVLLGFLIALTGVGITVIGMYLPIFQVADVAKG